MLPFIVISFLTLWLFYKLWMSAYNYWELKGFPFIPGDFPFGYSKGLATLSEYQGFIMQEMCSKMAQHPFIGIYVMRSPFLVVKDPELIRLILTKEFSHFRDRQPFQRNPKDILAHNNLFTIDGERWRAVRVKLTPTFTSGKLKNMYPLFVNCSEALNQLLLSRMESTVDIKDITNSFTNDTICTCAFGLEVSALTNEDDKFKKFGIDIFTPQISTRIKFAILNAFPWIRKLFVPRLVSLHMEKFILDIITENVKYREKNGLKRNDFIDLLMQMNKEGVIGENLKDEQNGDVVKPVEMTIEMMAAQCFLFFAAGFETSSSVLSYSLYEMAMNPEIQERVHDEIVKTIESHGGLTYQAIQDMNYLDMVIHETMRKYPTLPVLNRTCTKDFTMPTGHKVHVGDNIIIPTYALHHDPNYFPKPDIFDPERFALENKESIKPYTYLPFGEGPRICIGMRFGLLQTKMGFITVIRKYRVERADCTVVPLNFIGHLVVTTVGGPIKLKLSKRDDSM